MKDEQRQFLSLLGRPPARLTAEQVGWVLNFSDHDIPVLVAARLLKPLGNPPPNGVKFFAEVEIRELAGDRTWLARATNAIHQHWYNKNRNRTSHPGSLSPARASLQLQSSEDAGEIASKPCGAKTYSQIHGPNGAE